MQLKLTEKSVAAIATPLDAAQTYVWDADLHGFGVVVGKRSRTFVVRSRVGGSLVKRTIGQLGQPRVEGRLAADEGDLRVPGGQEPGQGEQIVVVQDAARQHVGERWRSSSCRRSCSSW